MKAMFNGGRVAMIGAGSALCLALPMIAAAPAHAAGTETQWITFPVISTRMVTEGTFPISVTASSGLPVKLTPKTVSVCTVNDSTVTVLDLGTCTIAADQAGDDTYAAAEQVTRSFSVIPVPGANDTTTTTLSSTTTNKNETIKSDILTTTLIATTTNTNDTVYHKYETIETTNTNITITHSGPGWETSSAGNGSISVNRASIRRVGNRYRVKVTGKDTKAGRTITLLRNHGNGWRNAKRRQIKADSSKRWKAAFWVKPKAKAKLVRVKASNGVTTVQLSLGFGRR